MGDALLGGLISAGWAAPQELAVVEKIEVRRDDGTVETLPRATLCRCGLSNHKPFCDNQHIAGGFQAPGAPLRIHLTGVRPRPLEPISKSADPRRLD